MKTGFLIFFIVLSVSFAIAYLALVDKIKSLNIELFKMHMANTVAAGIITDLPDNEAAHDIHKENFIKFLSDSRNWAYEYIESSQKEIREVAEELHKRGLDNYAERLFSLLPEK